MDTKSLRSRHVHWIQKLSQSHFRIDYYQDKTNRVADTYSRYLKHNVKEEITL